MDENTNSKKPKKLIKSNKICEFITSDLQQSNSNSSYTYVGCCFN